MFVAQSFVTQINVLGYGSINWSAIGVIDPRGVLWL